MQNLFRLIFRGPSQVYLGFLFTSLALLSIAHIFIPYSEFNLIINSTQSPIQDQFYKKLTFLGNGSFIVGIAMILLFRLQTLGTRILLSYALASLIVQTLKLTFFKGWPRPIEFFKENLHELHFVDGTNMALYNSFPSGHTASAFALTGILAFQTSNRFVQLLLFLVACLVGYSRVYLMQHFLRDVLAGAFIGYFCAATVYYWITRDKIKAAV